MGKTMLWSREGKDTWGIIWMVKEGEEAQPTEDSKEQNNDYYLDQRNKRWQENEK